MGGGRGGAGYLCITVMFDMLQRQNQTSVTCQFITADCTLLQGIKMISLIAWNRIAMIGEASFLNHMQNLRARVVTNLRVTYKCIYTEK